MPSSAEPPEPIAARRNDLDESILEAAAACFRQYGIRRTRMDDVAERAGVSRPLINQRFGSRADLIEAVTNFELDRLGAEIRRRSTPDLPFEDAVVELTLLSIRMAVENELLTDLALNTGHRDLGGLLLGFDRRETSMSKTWGPVFERGRRDGSLRTDLDDTTLIEWIMSVHVAFYLRRSVDDDHITHTLTTFVLPALTPAATT